MFTTRTMASIAILGALSAVLMRIEFSLPFVPPFYKLDFSEVAVLIGGFAFGPFAAVMIELLKNVIYVLFGGTSTAFVGELANFALGCAFVLPPILFYQKAKSRNHALIGLALGVLALIIVGAIVNYYVLLPMYSVIYQMPLDVIIAMGSAINPSVDGLSTFVFLMTCPFNFIKGLLVSIVVFLSYKKISVILKGVSS